MNAGQQNGAPVAVAGRASVRVLGRINKGDRLVSAGNGVARAASEDESINAFNVIGRAIQTKQTTGEGTVEALLQLINTEKLNNGISKPGDNILDDHYNDFATSVNAVWGSGSGDSGYGQTNTVSSVDTSTTVPSIHNGQHY